LTTRLGDTPEEWYKDVKVNTNQNREDTK